MRSELVLCLGLVSSIGCAVGGARLERAPRPVDRQDEAASSHISVISVARWEDYSEALQPTFGLKPEEALAQAVPATMRLEEKLVDAVLARLKLAPPTSQGASSESRVTESVSTVTGDIGTQSRTDTGRSEEAETTGPGNLGGVTTQSLTAPNAKDLPPATSSLVGTVSLDPMTRYWAASALYQEVQALNRYIRDAATRQASVPYVVRLQVSLIPVLRNQAYDASTTFAFFAGGPSPTTPVKAMPKPAAIAPAETASADALGEPSPGPGIRLVSTAETQAGAVDQPTVTRNADCGAEISNAPTIVPLLVTDSLEQAAHSRALSVVRDYGAALGMLTGGFGVGADVQRRSDTLNALIGHDLNSLLTVGRVTDNALRVRLGAMQQADSRYAMVPRTHNITLLVLVPRALLDSCGKRPALQVVSRTDITDSVRGITLRERSDAEVDALLGTVASRHPGVTHIGGSDTLRKLLTMAQRGRQDEFFKLVSERVDHPQALWLDLISTMTGSRYAPATIELPAPYEPEIGAGQLATLFDDTKATSVVTLTSGQDLLASQFVATLEVGTPGAEVAVPAQRIESLSGGRQLRLSFPSLRVLSLAPKDKAAPQVSLVLNREPAVWEPPGALREVRLAKVRYVAVSPAAEKEEQKPGEMTVSTGAVTADKGTGALRVTFVVNDATKKLAVAIQGADVSAVKSEPDGVLVRDGGSWKLAKGGGVDLSLRNLVSGIDLVISLNEDKKLIQQIRLQVQRAE